MAATKKSTTQKTPARKSAAKSSAAKKSAAKSSAARSSAAKKSTKKSAAKKSPASGTARKQSATKQSAKKQFATKQSGAKQSGPKKSTATRTSAAARSTSKKSGATNRSGAAGSAARSGGRKSTTKKSATKKSSTPDRRDAIAVLQADHRNVEELFAKFEGLGDRAHKTRESTVSKIIEELSVHAGIEETVFYPAVRERLAASQDSMVLEALEEHHLVKLTLDELQSMSAEDERYVAKVTVLREVVEHHVEEEENELFKRVRSAFSKAELADLGDELTAARSTAPTRPHPAAPDTPPGNIVANVLVAPLDAAANLTERAADAVRDRMS